MESDKRDLPNLLNISYPLTYLMANNDDFLNRMRPSSIYDELREPPKSCVVCGLKLAFFEKCPSCLRYGGQ